MVSEIMLMNLDFLPLCDFVIDIHHLGKIIGSMNYATLPNVGTFYLTLSKGHIH